VFARVLLCGPRALLCGTRGLHCQKVHGALSDEPIFTCVIEGIRHTVICGAKAEIFGLIQKDTKHGIMFVHAFQCGSEKAMPIADALAKAYMAFQLKSSTDPFKVCDPRGVHGLSAQV
jgi:hypothetical protein